MDEFGNGHADDSLEMVSENAIHSGEELRKRRSSRIVQAVPLAVKGVDALGRPFVEPDHQLPRLPLSVEALRAQEHVGDARDSARGSGSAAPASARPRGMDS